MKIYNTGPQPETAMPGVDEAFATGVDKTLAGFRQGVHQEPKDEQPPAKEETPTLRSRPESIRQSVTESNAAEFKQEQQSENNAKQRWHLNFGGFLYYSVLIAIVAAVYFSGMSGENQPRSIFGYSVFSVLTGSMASEIPQGSLVVTKYKDPNQINTGDDITYLLADLSTITHRVIEIHENHNESGVRGFRTKGIDNPMADENIVHPGNILGVVVFHVTGVGILLEYIQQNPLVIIGICVILIALIYTLRYICRT